MTSQAIITYTLLALVYLTPTVIVMGRLHPKTGPVIVVNIFLGWTLIGWVVALAMACSSQRAPVDTDPPPHLRHTTPPPPPPPARQTGPPQQGQA